MINNSLLQALIKEDKLLARIELLENQLEIFTRVSDFLNAAFFCPRDFKLLFG